MNGWAFALRPVEIADAATILRLRSDRERNRFLHSIVATAQAQEEYLRAYMARPGDFYFVVERKDNGAAEGLIGLYDIQAGQAEWGRWVLRPGSLAALESVILIMDFAFKICRLEEIWSMTVLENLPVVSFHESFGARRGAVHAARFRLDGRSWDAVEHRVHARDWPRLREPNAIRAADLASRLRAPAELNHG